MMYLGDNMRALVLSGGGAKGAYQVGALEKWIEDDGIDYDAFVGTSVGAINCACLAQASPGKLKDTYLFLRELWWNLENGKIYKKWFMGELAALWKPSVYCAAPLRQFIIDYLNYDALKKSGRKLRVVAVSWRTGAKIVATEEFLELEKWVYASASQPVFFDPAEIDGELYTDGGLRDIAPIGEAIKLGADEIDVIITGDPESPYDWDTKGQHTVQYALHMAGIMADEILLNDIKICELKNRMADLGEPYKKIKIRLLKPSRGVGESLDFSHEKIREMITFGYEDVKKQFG
jgi:NTE family protein